MAEDKPVTLAAITGAHGVTGEVRLKLFGEGIDALRQYKRFNGDTLSLKKIRDDGKGGAIARFAEVQNRAGAEALRGTVLSVPRSALPDLDEGEYYHADLVGLPAMTEAGETVGVVAAVHNFGATDIVEITKQPAPAKGMKSFMVPLTDQAVPFWDSHGLRVNADFVE